MEKLSEEVSTKHFHMQPRHIQLTTFVSPQSSPIAEVRLVADDLRDIIIGDLHVKILAYLQMIIANMRIRGIPANM